MPGDLDPTLSRALFTLPTGIEAVGGKTDLRAIARAKQASVLFDEIVVESGLRVVEIGVQGVVGTFQRGAAGLSKTFLHEVRSLAEDAQYGVAVVVTDDHVEIHIGTDIPRMDDARYFEQAVVARYVGDYHTGILDELADFGADWVRVVSVTRTPGETADVADERLARLGNDGPCDLSSVIELTPDEAKRLAASLGTALEEIGAEEPNEPSEIVAPQEAMLAADLADDVKLGDELRAIPALSGAFSTVAADRGVPIGLPGAESLGFVVPNVSVVPWEAIATFRDHPGAQEARAHLREFEKEAVAGERDQSAEFVRATARAVSDGLLGAAKDLAPSLPDDLRSPLLGTAVGFIPIMGQYASLAISMGDMISAIRAHEKFEGSWLAAVFELRDAAIEEIVDL